MESLQERVVLLKDLEWGFDNKPPKVKAKIGEWYRTWEVDPAPGYHHDIQLTREILAICEERFPIEPKVRLFLLDREEIGRVNGWTTHDYKYEEKDAHDRNIMHPGIVLVGKRIPIHPAMTRYLVAHEYGHAVDTFLARARYAANDAEALQNKEYIALREMVPPPYYGPGQWHATPGEVFANDFRILIAEQEKEFWPHDVVHPEHEFAQSVREWWKARWEEVQSGHIPCSSSD